MKNQWNSMDNMNTKPTVLEIIVNILWKIFSVRVLVTLALTYTICWALMKSFSLLECGLESGNKDSIAIAKEILMFIAGALVGAFTSTITKYFDRTDRWKKENPNEEGDTK